MKSCRIVPILWIVSIAIVALLFACGAWFGDLNQDEGWYLYSARMVAEGQLPFIDFASTQGPLMSLAYACAWPLVEQWGVAGGRLFTTILGLACLVAASCLAARLLCCQGPEPGTERRNGGTAALVCLIFLGVNVYQASFFTIVKTYALSGLLLSLGFLSLTYLRGKRGWLAALLSGIFLTMATGARLSAAVTVPMVFLVLVFSRAVPKKTAAISFFIGSAATACILFLPAWRPGRLPRG